MRDVGVDALQPEVLRRHERGELGRHGSNRGTGGPRPTEVLFTNLALTRQHNQAAVAFGSTKVIAARDFMSVPIPPPQ